MSLDVTKLENRRELAGGMVQARCPACAEGGHDRAGQHLRIYPNGRFGCCVHPKDKDHRKRIFALVGVRELGTFALRLKASSASPATRSVKAALTAFESGALGTPETDLGNGVRAVRRTEAMLASPLSKTAAESGMELEGGVRGVRTFPRPRHRTPRTGIPESRARAREEGSPIVHTGEDFQEKLKDWESGVRAVRAELEVEPLSAAGERLPYLTPGGTLVIPFDSPERYHWWKGGQSVAATLAEVRSRRSEVGMENKDAATV